MEKGTHARRHSLINIGSSFSKSEKKSVSLSSKVTVLSPETSSEDDNETKSDESTSPSNPSKFTQDASPEMASLQSNVCYTSSTFTDDATLSSSINNSCPLMNSDDSFERHSTSIAERQIKISEYSSCEKFHHGKTERNDVSYSSNDGLGSSNGVYIFPEPVIETSTLQPLTLKMFTATAQPISQATFHLIAPSPTVRRCVSLKVSPTSSASMVPQTLSFARRRYCELEEQREGHCMKPQFVEERQDKVMDETSFTCLSLASATPSMMISQSSSKQLTRRQYQDVELHDESVATSVLRGSPVCGHFTCRYAAQRDFTTVCRDPTVNQTQMNRKEMLHQYRLHITVSIIFLAALLLVTSGWYFKDKVRKETLRNQKIFIDPKARVLSLTQQADGKQFHIKFGQDIPSWQLPMHCPDVKDGSISECFWKNEATLRIVHFLLHRSVHKSDVQCYNVSWTMDSSTDSVPMDCFELGSAAWYGPSNKSNTAFPITGSFYYTPSPYNISNGGVFSSVVELYWLSSSGIGVMIQPDGFLSIQWNMTKRGHFCVTALLDQSFSRKKHGDETSLSLRYTVCEGSNVVQTHFSMKNYISGWTKPTIPSTSMLLSPHWSMSGLANKHKYEQNDVIASVGLIKDHNLSCGVLILDGQWQKYEGDLDFDSDRFSNLTELAQAVKGTCKTALQVSPFFDYRSQSNFHHAVTRHLLVKDAGGSAAGLFMGDNLTIVASLDASSAAARSWYSKQLSRLSGQASVTVFRLSYGRHSWLPHHPTFSDPHVSLHQLRRMMSDLALHHHKAVLLEHSSNTQSLPSFVTIETIVKVDGGKVCLTEAIEMALVLGMLGYPFVLSDGVRLTSTVRTLRPDGLGADLFIRSMQMSAFFPAFKFSTPPWVFEPKVTELAVNLSRLHADIVRQVIVGDQQLWFEVNSGLPIIRPVWWVDSGNPFAHDQKLDNEFMVGDSLLVAPVLCEGVRKRDIYVPPGVWNDQLHDTVVLGPTILKDYLVDLYEVPRFLRMLLHDDASSSA